MKRLPWCQLTVYVKKGVCTDIDSIYHSVTDTFVTGLQISFYLTYMGNHDIWKEVYYEYSPILYRIWCISRGKGSRYFLYKDIYRSATGVQIAFCKTCVVNPQQLEKRNNFDNISYIIQVTGKKGGVLSK